MRRRVLGLAVFCLLAGSRWLVENAFPSTLPSLMRQSLHFALMGAVAAPLWIMRRSALARNWWRLSIAGLLLLGLPSILNEIAATIVAHAGVALYTLVPLVVVVGVAASSAETGSRALMMPALLGMAGGLLVLPFELPSTVYGGILLGVVLVAVVLTAAGGVWMQGLLQGMGLAQSVCIVCGANALLLGAAGLRFEAVPGSASSLPGEMLRAAAFDLPEFLLLIWLLQELSPARLAVRYLFVPLVTVVEGLILLRSPLDLRTGFGLLLMAAGGGALLFGSAAAKEEPPGLHLSKVDRHHP